MELLKNKTILSSLLVVIMAVLAYNLFLKGNSIVPTEADRNIGADLVQMSLELSQATFSQELFSKPSYRQLADFSTPIPEQPIGRGNPFGIIGRD